MFAGRVKRGTRTADGEAGTRGELAVMASQVSDDVGRCCQRCENMGGICREVKGQEVLMGGIEIKDMTPRNLNSKGIRGRLVLPGIAV